MSHLLEHMVFKGTPSTERRRHRAFAGAARRIARCVHHAGAHGLPGPGARRAPRRRRSTCWPTSCSSRACEDADLALEREVVLEEIAQVEDTPDDLVFELHGGPLWEGHPYGRSDPGDARTPSPASTAETLRSLHDRAYTGGNLVVAAAGQRGPRRGRRPGASRACSGTCRAGERTPPVSVPLTSRRGYEAVDRATAQTHLVFGTGHPGARASRTATPSILLSAALGGGMSSRLFQTVREELGLCYSVFTLPVVLRRPRGVSGVYVGTRPATAEKAGGGRPRRAGPMLAGSRAAGRGARRSRSSQIKGQIMLSLESTGLASLPPGGLRAPRRTVRRAGRAPGARSTRSSADDGRRVAAEYYRPRAATGHARARPAIPWTVS